MLNFIRGFRIATRTRFRTGIQHRVKNEKMMIDHMNDDHSNVIQSALHAQHGIKDKNVKMFALSTDGYYVYSKKEIFFITFNKPIYKALDYRKILVKQAEEYRSYEL